jgi:hypothetical protein
MRFQKLRAELRAGVVDAVLKSRNDHGVARHIDALQHLFGLDRGARRDDGIGGAVNQGHRRLRLDLVLEAVGGAEGA